MAKLVNILLQKSDPEYPWGFSLGAQPPAQHSVQITWVDNGSLASEHLEAGDRVLEIEGVDTTTMSNAEVESLLKNPSKKLELLIMKKPKVKISPSVFESKSEIVQKSETKNVFEERRKTEIKVHESKSIQESKKNIEESKTLEKSKKEDKFWTSPPPDLQVPQKSDFVSQSTIFQNLNRYKNENRKFDPREEKRKFWESCRKGDSVRRFKWGDGISRMTSPYAKSDGSTESLYFKAETSSKRYEERSKSCEPYESKKELSPTNPFSAHYCEPKHEKIPEIKVTDHQKKVHFENDTNDFNSKYEFFEKTMSVPISVHKNAVGIVEEALKEPSTSYLSKNRDSLPSTFEKKETVRRFSNPSCLKKPSDFINQNRKKDPKNDHFQTPKIENSQNLQKKNRNFEATNEGQVFNESLPNNGPTEDSGGMQEYSQKDVYTQEDYSRKQNQEVYKTEGYSQKEEGYEQNLDGYTMQGCSQKVEGYEQNQQDYSKMQKQNAKGYQDGYSQKAEGYEQNQQDCSRMQQRAEDYQKWHSQKAEGYEHNEEGYKLDGYPQKVEGYEQNQQDCSRMQQRAEDYQEWHSQKAEGYEHNEECYKQDGYPQKVQGYEQNQQDCSRMQKQGAESYSERQECSQKAEVYERDGYSQKVDGYEQNQQDCSRMQQRDYQECHSQKTEGYEQNQEGSKRHGFSQKVEGYEQNQEDCSRMQNQIVGYNQYSQNQDLRKQIVDQRMKVMPNDRNVTLTKKEFVEGLYEHKKRTFTESSYEKVTRCPRSPYENVESACRREYKEEDLRPFKSVKDRSKTPSGFYDNYAEKPEIPAETYENIRSKLGDLLGGRPTRPVKRVNRKEENVEEAFRELALKEGLLDDDSAYEYYYERQSSQIAANNGSSIPAPPEMCAAVPPPPPPPVQGGIPPVRIASEIGAKKHYEPPAAIQNAMMTKDKKPFTYTPGGLDLAEIRSPRMARRINRNAHMEDSCTPQLQQRPGGVQQPLPPSALAAMQPQIAIPVFPPGGGFQNQFPPPPPPMPQVASSPDGDFPPPPPPLQSPGTPTSAPFPPPPPPPMPENRPSYINDIQNHPPLRSVERPNFVAEIPSHPPLKHTNQPPRSSYDPNNANPIQIQLKPVSPKPVPTGPPYIPTQPIYVQQKPPEALYSENAPKTEYQKPMQNTGPPFVPTQPIYVQQKPPENVQPIKQKTPEYQKLPPLQMPAQPPKPQTPQTPNKSPAPWMSSRQVSKESPPWTVRSPAESPQPSQAVTRVIPIQIEGQEPAQKPSYQPPQYQKPQFPPQQPQFQQNYQQAPVYQQPPYQPSEEPRTRIIPIQIEGAEQRNFSTQQSVQNQNFQRSISVEGRPQSQNSWSPNPIQSRSFRVLQKITGSEEEPIDRLDESEY